MKKQSLTSRETRRLQERYDHLIAQLSNFASLSQGSVMRNPPGAWRWTRKVRGKTVSLGLSAAQAQKMKEAIANHRALDILIDELREITQKLILHAPESTDFSSLPKRPKSPLS